MALETPDKLHAIAQLVPVVSPPFTSEILSSDGFASFVRNGPGNYDLAFIDGLAFSGGYAEASLSAGANFFAGAQILEDGSGVRVMVQNANGEPADPPFVGVKVWAVQQSEGLGPAVPPPLVPVGFGAGLLPSLVFAGPGVIQMLPGVLTQFDNTAPGASVLTFPTDDLTPATFARQGQRCGLHCVTAAGGVGTLDLDTLNPAAFAEAPIAEPAGPLALFSGVSVGVLPAANLSGVTAEWAWDPASLAWRLETQSKTAP